MPSLVGRGKVELVEANCQNRGCAGELKHMLADEEVKFETFRLADGGISLRLTHCPTGICVVGDPSGAPFVTQLAELHKQLAQLVNESTNP